MYPLELSASLTFPRFVIVTDFAALGVPTTALNVRLLCETCPNSPSIPVPVKESVAGLLLALEAMDTVPARAPAAFGVKFRSRIQ
jgi:hypothetical protein